MGLIRAASGRGLRADLDINDERLWSGYAPVSAAGVPVTTETAMRISTVWGCVRLISQSLASIPLIVYRSLGDDGRERARNMPVYDLLHDAPNEEQTAFEFKRLMTVYALLRGNALAFIKPGPRGPIDQLVPIHPDRYRAPEWVNGQMRYPILGAQGKTEYFWSDEIFHLCGLSFDGYWGVSVIEYARETMGLSMATESYGARFFSQNATPVGLLTHPGKINREGRDKLADEWNQRTAGLSNAHRTAVMAEGVTYTPISINAQDSQFLETRQFQVADVARWFGVDLTLLQENTKSTSWGTGIEAMLLAFKTFTLLPWARLWEGAIQRDLILAPQTYFAEYLFDALVRPDLLTRYQAYDVAVKGGWKSRNEVRRLENDNPVKGLDGYDRPLNVGDATGPGSGGATDDQNRAHYRGLLRESAGRVVRKEQAALTRAMKLEDAEARLAAIEGFYAEHAAFVAQTLRMDAGAAEAWVEDRKATALNYGADGMVLPNIFGDDQVARLAQLAEEHHV